MINLGRVSNIPKILLATRLKETDPTNVYDRLKKNFKIVLSQYFKLYIIKSKW